MERLPEWERGTPAVLCVAGPHPIPITAYLRADDNRVLLALGRQRETLRRLRKDPEELEAADTVVAVELAVDRIQNHLADGRTEMLDGARWRWCAEEDGEAEDAILAELARL